VTVTGRKRLVLVIALAVAVVGLAGGLTAVFYPRSEALTPAPPQAVRAATALASRNLASVRQSLAAGYTITDSDLAPAGTSIRLLPGTWKQQENDAAVGAVVTVPGHAPVTEVIYLVYQEGLWRVLFTDPS
jgi:hypothetical protein